MQNHHKLRPYNLAPDWATPPNLSDQDAQDAFPHAITTTGTVPAAFLNDYDAVHVVLADHVVTSSSRFLSINFQDTNGMYLRILHFVFVLIRALL